MRILLAPMPPMMGGGPPAPPEALEPDADNMAGAEQCVPLKMLAQPDDQEQVQTPAVGDSVTLTVDATVTRIEGDNAYIKPSAINGQPLEETKTPTPEETDAQEGSELRGEADKLSQL